MQPLKCNGCLYYGQKKTGDIDTFFNYSGNPLKQHEHAQKLLARYHS